MSLLHHKYIHQSERSWKPIFTKYFTFSVKSQAEDAEDINFALCVAQTLPIISQCSVTVFTVCKLHKYQLPRPHPAASLLSVGTALHLVVITEASGAAGVARALSHILAQDLATRVGNILYFG